MASPWKEKWKEIKKLPSGGQGHTAIVRSCDSNTAGVIKILKRQNSKKARRRFADEVHNLRVVRHAGGKVPRFFDGNTEAFDQSSLQLYFVMELIAGQTLEELVDQDGHLTLEMSISLLGDLMKTVRIAHNEGVMHRDFKPNNVMIRSADPVDVVVLDFGLSFRPDKPGVTDQSERIASRFLTLPERSTKTGDKRDVRSDLTLLAGLLFFSLTGDQPEFLRDEQELAPHRRDDKLRDLIDNPSCVAELEYFFDQAFKPQLDHRFQSIDAFNDALQAVLHPQLRRANRDLKEYARSLNEELIRNDLASMHHAFRPQAAKVMQAIEEKLHELRSEIDPFILEMSSFNKDKEIPNGAPPKTTSLGIQIIRFAVKAPAHSFSSGKVYTVRAVDSECVLARRTVRSSGIGIGTAHGDWVNVYRFSGLEEPHLDAVQQDIEASIQDALTDVKYRIDNKTWDAEIGSDHK